MDGDPLLNGRLPNLFLAGAPKCGTTSIFTALSEHDQISRLAEKEPDTLVKHEIFADSDEALRLDRILKDYRSNTPANCNSRYLMDGSVNYIYSAVAREFISRYVHDPKILFVLRNPVDRYLSNFFYFREVKSIIPRSWKLKDFVDIQLGGRSDIGHEQVDCALQHGCYSTYLREWAGVFTPDNLHIVTLEEYARDYYRAIDDIMRWLCLAPTGAQVADGKHNNSTYAVKSTVFHAFASATAHYFPQGKLKDGLRDLYVRFNGESLSRSELDPYSRSALSQFYEQEVLTLHREFNLEFARSL